MSEQITISPTARAVLDFLAAWPDGESAPTLRAIHAGTGALLHDVSHVSYTLKRLVQLGLVDDHAPDGRRLTDAGRAVAGGEE